MKKSSVIGVFAIILSFVATAQGQVLKATDCIREALAHSPSLAQSNHQIAADREDITKKKGSQLPYLSSELQGYMVNGSPVSEWTALNAVQPENGITPTGRRTFPLIHWAPVGIENIGVTYPLVFQGSFMGLNDPPPVATAKATLTEAELNKLVSEQKVIFDVLTQYVYATGYRQQLVTQEEMVKLNDEQLTVTHEEVRKHAKPAYENQIAEAQLKAAQDSERALRMNEDAALTQLAVLIGRNDAPVELDPTPPPLSQLEPARELMDKMIAAHPALKVQEAAVEIARQQLRADAAARWPSVTLNTSFDAGQDLERFNGGTGQVRPTAFLSYLTVDIPIFDFGQRRAAKAESDELLKVQQDAVAQLKVDLRTSMAQSYNDILQDAQAAAELKGTYYKNLEAADLAEAQRKQGVVDQLAVLAAQITARTSLIAVQQEEMAERLKYVELQNLSGGTWHWLQ
jgi:outer membrane protein TolC